MEDKLDRELIARNLINIIDVKNCTNYTIFMDDEIYNILQDHIIKMFGVDEMAIEEIKKFLNNNKQTIKKIEDNSPISIDEKNKLFIGLVNLKRKYVLK